VFDIKFTHFDKLKQLYCKTVPITFSNDEDLFNSCVWALLQRYKTLFGIERFEGQGLQASLPEAVFELLIKHFDIGQEVFASPLNCYFSNYCSAFIDTDWMFGSCGTFFDFLPVSGSFEANPPFVEEVMEAMADHIELILTSSNKPLSFAVFVPDWIDPPANALVKMSASKFLRAERVIKEEHYYICGGQHLPSDNTRYYKAIHGTHIYFLQNDEGYITWPPTQEKLDDIVTAMVTNS